MAIHIRRREFIFTSRRPQLHGRSRRARSRASECGASVCCRYSLKATWIGVPVLKCLQALSKSLGGRRAVTFKSIIAGLRAMLSA